MRRIIPGLCLGLLIAAGVWEALDLYPVLLDRRIREAEIADRQNFTLPAAEQKPTDTQVVRNVKQPPQRTEVNWDVPFTSQAPFGEWDPDHKEACEEASVLMVLRYFEGKPFESPDDADAALLRLVRKVEMDMKLPVDITAQQAATLIALENQDLTVSVVADPTEESIKNVLDQGKLVIVPVAGRMLKNPYFQSPGPPYHMLVVRGYTADGYVITNDPGTKHGNAFPYRWATLLGAIHDWNGGDVEKGGRVAVVVGPFVPWKL